MHNLLHFGKRLFFREDVLRIAFQHTVSDHDYSDERKNIKICPVINLHIGNFNIIIKKIRHVPLVFRSLYTLEYPELFQSSDDWYSCLL